MCKASSESRTSSTVMKRIIVNVRRRIRIYEEFLNLRLI